MYMYTSIIKGAYVFVLNYNRSQEEIISSKCKKKTKSNNIPIIVIDI